MRSVRSCSSRSGGALMLVPATTLSGSAIIAFEGGGVPNEPGNAPIDGHSGLRYRPCRMSLLSVRTLPAGFIAPCPPRPPRSPPAASSGCMRSSATASGFIARKIDNHVKLYSPGNDLTQRFPLILEALASLRARSCIIDGEAVACGEDGIAVFERI
jgi:hypothetical protein